MATVRGKMAKVLVLAILDKLKNGRFCAGCRRSMGMGRIPYFGVVHACGFDGATAAMHVFTCQ